MTPWAHQTHAIQETLAALQRGERKICVTIPTGGGKTLVMQELAREFLNRGKNVILYSNRKLLIEQISNVLLDAGLYHGIRAAGYEEEHDCRFQVSSIQTEHARVMRSKSWYLYPADLALVDEAHLQGGPSAKAILDAHVEAGASYIGLTATPFALSHAYDTLIESGTVSELRACGALVLAHHYAPDEPDMRAFKKMREEALFAQADVRKAIMTPSIFGRVWEWFNVLNPERKPTILFAPGVAESLWFAEQFEKQGVKAAHIDGEDVYVEGELFRSNATLRKQILERSRQRDLVVLCNRFVLREGLDCPWLSCGIFATIFGSMQSYLQAGGRLLRASPGMDSVTIIDHGGNYWRWGSLNADREWRLDLTDNQVATIRANRLRKGEEDEPFRCPQCGRVWVRGSKCNPAWGGCGYELDLRKRSRPVVSTDGSLREMEGKIFRPRRISKAPNGPKLWERMYYRSRTEKGSRTFQAAAALFAQENRWSWPDPAWPLMPTREVDWVRLVADVPREHLTTGQLVPSTSCAGG